MDITVQQHHMHGEIAPPSRSNSTTFTDKDIFKTDKEEGCLACFSNKISEM
jgi:hypothetical protein